MIDSHQDCNSQNARLRLELALLVRRPALVSAGLSGWKSYPLTLDASLHGDAFRARLGVAVGYSSTCPCSAALSRQLVEQGFWTPSPDRSVWTPKRSPIGCGVTPPWPHPTVSAARPESPWTWPATATPWACWR